MDMCVDTEALELALSKIDDVIGNLTDSVDITQNSVSNAGNDFQTINYERTEMVFSSVKNALSSIAGCLEDFKTYLDGLKGCVEDYNTMRY